MTLNVARVSELIAHLEKQPEERFHMGFAFFDQHPCGSAACLLGHGNIVWGARYRFGIAFNDIADRLGLSKEQAGHLFTPDGWRDDIRTVAARWPLSRAIATLKRLRDVYEATGQVVVDWGPEPGEEPKREWSAPIVSGGLPSSITDVLNGKPLSLTVEQVDG